MHSITTRPLSLLALVLVCFAVPAVTQAGTDEPTPPNFEFAPVPSLPAPAPEPNAAPAANVAPEATAATTASPVAVAESIEAPHLLAPSLTGPVGLYRVSTAEVGPAHHLRLGIHGEYLQASGFLIDGDENSRLQGGLTFGYTLHPAIELFGAVLSSSNRNTRESELGRRDPELIKSFGDLVLGAKAVLPSSGAASLGLELGLKFLSGISELSFSPSSTSAWFGPVFTLDLRRAAQLPIRVHANAGFYLDNSRNLSALADTTLQTREVAMFAYGMGASRVRGAIALDAPIEGLGAGILLLPFVEYHAEYVTASGDPAFSPTVLRCGGLGQPECAENRDQHWLTIGARARFYRGLAAHAGLDMGLRSVGFPYGPPVPSWNLLFGLAYALDIDAFRRPVIVTRVIEKERIAPPTEGRVAGRVKSGQAGGPVADAVVAVIGRPHGRVVTDADGSFKTHGLPAGPVEIEVTAPNFEPTKTTAFVTLGGEALVDVTLTPKTPTGIVRGRVTDDRGMGLDTVLRFVGPQTVEAKTDPSGAFTATLMVGAYKVTAEAPGFPARERQLEIAAGQDRQLDLMLRNRTPNPDVSLADGTIVLKKPVKFVGGGTKLDPSSAALLDGIADVLDDHEEIRSVRIEAHWDASAGKKANELTQLQAGKVKEYLVQKGVQPARLDAVGVGAQKPVVPNIGPANKARNRRVEFHVGK